MTPAWRAKGLKSKTARSVVRMIFKKLEDEFDRYNRQKGNKRVKKQLHSTITEQRRNQK